MSHLNFWNFGIFHQFLSYLKASCLVTLFDRKLTIFVQFAMLNETFSVIFKHCDQCGDIENLETIVIFVARKTKDRWRSFCLFWIWKWIWFVEVFIGMKSTLSNKARGEHQNGQVQWLTLRWDHVFVVRPSHLHHLQQCSKINLKCLIC